MPCTIKLLKVPEGSTDFYSFEEYDDMVHAATKTSANAHRSCSSAVTVASAGARCAPRVDGREPKEDSAPCGTE